MVINAGFIKMLTGRDDVTCRQMYSSEIIEFKPIFGLIMLRNKIPEFDKSDEAIWDRCKCIKYPTKFVDEPNKENEKKKDDKLGMKLKNWKNDFMLLLLEFYVKYKEEGLKEPESVKHYTQGTKEDQDIYSKFFNECTEPSKTHIHKSVLYIAFKEWYKTNNIGTNMPSSHVFGTELEKKYIVKSVKMNGMAAQGVMCLNLKQIETNNCCSDN